ncbi:EamA family transporter [Methylophaga sp.]|uniref:EamA family transporter n=1 Tax=Methylophaga sp. TaxID=2024840 RepID=UPI003F6FD079
MSYLTLLMILASVMLSVAAQLSLKAGMGRLIFPETWISIETAGLVLNRFVILGLFCYGMSMVFWLYVLTKVEVSRAYPFVGLGFVGTMLFAHFLLHEPITIQKLIGTMLVVSGVFLLAR